MVKNFEPTASNSNSLGIDQNDTIETYMGAGGTIDDFLSHADGLSEGHWNMQYVATGYNIYLMES
jgi:hypothetical protein